ncbi:winged helix-turn-helix transcriptional regulator [Brevibacillus sp. SYP-B805]|uniref:ArsR/SmtB family transcription factor n=1 Tax=Brevibacillus sp. SYP-B805 TaxID=1578199 RepID=UPI0013ECE560|nr:metalloregulator ArsR/SmtB family transcription factor [Brevibacillus sp. SYP-B805]NGQ95987.1 winged helix-turn-helix transcriptional regulator [Brevibacillus sp. SYP-B805]
MKLLDMSHGRSTYTVELAVSPLFECALGIAAATYPEIHPTLEQPPSCWEELVSRLTDEERREFRHAQEHNTWKTLLQLLHARPFADLADFLDYVSSLDARRLRYESLPFLGMSQEERRQSAADGDRKAVRHLIDRCRDHKFFPAYIRYICEADTERLKRHLTTLMAGWHRVHIAPAEERLTAILHRDVERKRGMLASLAPEAFVEWATGGLAYPPEPEVTRVLLVPHCVYRPWNIQADAVRTKIFYYPVADDSLDEGTDPYRPPLSLVQRFKALGDEHRMRMIKLLSEREMTLQELTEKLALSKSTIHHHLSMLRSAQLVETAGTSYRLKPQTLGLLAGELQHYLEKKGGLRG